MAGALGLSFVLPALEGRAAERRGTERPKSLILLWMGGGPSQLETWDPHPGSMSGGETQAIKTRIPDCQIADTYPQVAEQLDSLSVIRSLVSKEGDHERGTVMVKTGYPPEPTLVHPSLGAILAHELPEAGVEIPRHVSLGPAQWPGRGGFFGDQYDAFKVFEPGAGLHNMRARAEGDRQDRRLANLGVLESSFRRGRAVQLGRTLHRDTLDRALTMMHSEQLKAFEIEGEPAAIRAAYGETNFGRGCLVARRLVEVGVRCVEVTLNGWDTHANNFEGHRANAETLDPALASLVRELRERDLLDSTVVLCIGEFGRTPQINPLGGRDHWPTGFSCLLGGGGLRSGLVIGATDPDQQQTMPTDPVTVKDLYATLLRTLGVEYDKEVMTPIGRPMALSAGRHVERLLDEV
ncbi:MAG TPA: DUF1501 domain-containing protein [Planctomycetaceae bacterium]|nr:DUF1501 domain-containing protein [Planctomycetaceae bacterium]